MILTFATSCGKDAEKEKENEVKSVTLSLVDEGKTDYQIVYPNSLPSSYISSIRAFAGSIRKECKANIPTVTDENIGKKTDYEIIIGDAERESAKNALAALNDDSFSFSLSDKSVIVSVSNNKIIDLALNKFLDLFLKDGKIELKSEEFPMTFKCKKEYDTVKIDNTKNVNANDPYIVKHDGVYYYCWSGNGVMVSKISNLNNVTTDNGKNVFNAEKNGFSAVWAPELHYIDGDWYIYVAMCKGSSDNSKHRMYCLKCTGNEPTSEFKLVGQVTDKTNRWAIDGTVFKYNGELYTVWSGWEGTVDVCQNLYIAHMSDPWTIDSSRVMISTPSTWDGLTKGPSVNEGPCAVVVDGTLYIIYSGNGSWTDDYCLGYVKLTGDDPLKAKDWTKSEAAFLRKNKQTYGPGHCSVVQADDDTYYVVYHANLESGTGWGGRSLRIQPITITSDSIPKITPAMSADLKIAHYELDE